MTIESSSIRTSFLRSSSKCLLDLLPISSRSSFKTIAKKIHFLELYRDFAQIGIDAVRSFQKGELKKFDAHVGDTSCQIRAYCTIMLFNSQEIKIKYQQYIDDLDLLLKKIHEYVLHLSKDSENSYITTFDLLAQTQLSYELDSDFVYIFLTYFLGKYTYIDAEIEIIGRIQYGQLIQDLASVKKGPIVDMIKHHQRILAEASCNFMWMLADNGLPLSSLTRSLERSIRIDVFKRKVLPAFLSGYMILTDLMFGAGVDLRLICKIHQNNYVELVYSKDLEKNKFLLTNTLRAGRPYLVIQGDASCVQSIQELIENIEVVGGIYHLLLQTFATHEHFSGVQEVFNEIFFAGQIEKSVNLYEIQCLKKLYDRLKCEGAVVLKTGKGKVFHARHIYTDFMGAGLSH